MATTLFLRPIIKTLGEVGEVRSEGQLSLEKTKWRTLVGASLAVLSSTAFYINFGLATLLGDPGKPFFANPYLNVLVFGINLDSTLNDVGMLLVSDALKAVSLEAISWRYFLMRAGDVLNAILAWFKHPSANPQLVAPVDSGSDEMVAPVDSDSDENVISDIKKRHDVSGSAESLVGTEETYSQISISRDLGLFGPSMSMT